MNDGKVKGGSFRELKAHLLLFDNAEHRHDRGWPHAPRQKRENTGRKPRWQTVGIIHFRHHGDADQA
jgi:hypothetical protein